MKQLVILRGVSGAGKSTYAKKLADENGAVVLSADDYFVGDDGVYRFDADKLTYAHDECRKKAVRAMCNESPLVVIDNTNTRLWEMKPYLQMADLLGYQVEVVRLIVPSWLAFYRNVHGMELNQIERQAKRFENYDGERRLVWAKHGDFEDEEDQYADQ